MLPSLNGGLIWVTMKPINAKEFLQRIKDERMVRDDTAAISYVIGFLEGWIERQEVLLPPDLKIDEILDDDEDELEEVELFDDKESTLLSSSDTKRKALKILMQNRLAMRTREVEHKFEDGETTYKRVHRALTYLTGKNQVERKVDAHGHPFWTYIKQYKPSDPFVKEEDEGKGYVIVKGDLKP